jgi:hypothetical protein
VQFNGYSLRVESVRENRVEAVRIRHSTDDTGEIHVVPGPTGP